MNQSIFSFLFPLKVWPICLPVFAEDSSETELRTINTDFTFELFICAAILLENRESLLQCRDDAQLIQFTSRCVWPTRPQRSGFCLRFYSFQTNVPFVQPSGNAGFEQHTWEGREPLVQLLQALHVGLHERTVQRWREQRRGLPLSAPRSACFKMTSRTFMQPRITPMDSSLQSRYILLQFLFPRKTVWCITAYIWSDCCCLF